MHNTLELDADTQHTMSRLHHVIRAGHFTGLHKIAVTHIGNNKPKAAIPAYRVSVSMLQCDAV